MNQIIYHPSGMVEGEISLEGSKSITNRALIIRALTPSPFQILNIPSCEDAVVMRQALDDKNASTIHVKSAGTAGRFLTAFYAFQKGTQIIDADEGLKERPVKPLLDVLQSLGCRIESVHGDERFPLKIYPFNHQLTDVVKVPGHISSQFVTALLLVAPTLPLGLNIHVDPDQVSKPYIEMTVQVMAYFGVEVNKSENTLQVKPQVYRPKDITIEGDWSSASYYFGIAALSKSAEIGLRGLHKISWQGDHKIMAVCAYFGIQATFKGDILWINKSTGCLPKPFIEWDFIECPDLFQTISLTAAALSMQGAFTGLNTLIYKETNRLSAVKETLQQCTVYLNKMPDKFSSKQKKEIYFLEGQFHHPSEDVAFKTYQDHRMAMSLAMWGMRDKTNILDPGVVSKSYPEFWNDLQKIGYILK